MLKHFPCGRPPFSWKNFFPFQGEGKFRGISQKGPTRGVHPPKQRGPRDNYFSTFGSTKKLALHNTQGGNEEFQGGFNWGTFGAPGKFGCGGAQIPGKVPAPKSWNSLWKRKRFNGPQINVSTKGEKNGLSHLGPPGKNFSPFRRGRPPKNSKGGGYTPWGG